MTLPNTRHPKTFKVGNITVQVVTFMPITDPQAMLIVRLFERQQPAAFRARSPQVLTLPWMGDAATLASVEAAADNAGETLRSLLGPGGGFQPRRR